jgi:hypothetical protein
MDASLFKELVAVLKRAQRVGAMGSERRLPAKRRGVLLVNRGEFFGLLSPKRLRTVAGTKASNFSLCKVTGRLSGTET